MGACILCHPAMPMYLHICIFFQVQLQLGVLFSQKPMLGVSADLRTYEHPQATCCVSPSRRRSKQWRRELIPACIPIQPEHFASSTIDPGDQLNKEEGA